jgi:putative selenate reductase
MSDLFQPLTSEQLIEWVFTELESRDSILGIPGRHFFAPAENDPFRTTAFGQALETPFGPAAGPHSQMAQNIVASWLCGARYIELKTVQTLDVLDVSKPCIDMEDEGYNVEWSQELRVHQSFDEYLRAWVLIHALHHKLGFPGRTPGVVFNLSVGYDLDGIRQPNMQWFLDRVRDCSTELDELVGQVARHHPAVKDLAIPCRLSDNVTLSTMHGCPPGEIGSICNYLMKERGLHTFVKCNPTLLGPDRVRTILHEDLGFGDAIVPDEAFEHDLDYRDAVPLLKELKSTAAGCGLEFGVKLSNTLQVENFRQVFDSSEKMMYLSGRPLHAITVNLAADLAEEFLGGLPMSFSAGADCFNAPQLLGAGMKTVTVCSDLLKTGGYLRLLQYLESTRNEFRRTGAGSIDDYVRRTSRSGGRDDLSACATRNLRRYAQSTPGNRMLKKSAFHTSHSKTGRGLDLFDCIKAPCTDQCPVDQKVPQYMQAVRGGDLDSAARLTRLDNPLPGMLGRICDHLCEPVCIRTHLDEPLAIRHVKRFIMEHEKAAATELALAGQGVEIFEMHSHAGGMVGGAIPEYRFPRGVLDRELAVPEALGVRIHYNTMAGRDIQLSQLRRDGFAQVVIMAGAQRGKTLGLEGEDCTGVMDALYFLRQCREGKPLDIGRRIGVIGAGDTAMDCARTAWRLSGGGSGGRVCVIYRRTIDQMPADREEIDCLLEEGIEVIELARPEQLVVEGGRLKSLVCRRMEYRGERDQSGRKIPRDLPGSDFEVPLDTLILAISQHAILDFFDGEAIEVNRKGYISADPITFETSVPGVYAGGDVVNDGPSSIVEAAADGKAIARSILGRQGPGVEPEPVDAFDTADLLRRRSHREWRVPVPHTAGDDRRNFNEVVLGYSGRQARQEASRCLDCDRYCSLCVGVCPNLALQTFQVSPYAARIPLVTVEDGRISLGRGPLFKVRQAYQVAVLTDLCNACGNCTTFCPAAGSPYLHKPRLYLDQAEFEAQRDNAFMLLRGDEDGTGGQWAMEARWSGATHRIRLDGKLHYEGPSVRARIEPTSFDVEHIKTAGAGRESSSISLDYCAAMYVLLNGLRQSLPYLPAARRDRGG